jgi:hypothetical protein
LAANAADAPTASDKQINVNMVFINNLSYFCEQSRHSADWIAPIDRMSRSVRRCRPRWRANKRAMEKVQHEFPREEGNGASPLKRAG